MRLRNDIAVEKVGEDYWLIPYSGAQADHVKSFQINDLAAYLATQLQSEITERALVELAADHTGSKCDEIRDDVREFTSALSDAGLLIDNRFSEFYPGSVFLNIGGINIVYNGDRAYLDERLTAFSCPTFEPEECDLSVFIEDGVIDDNRLRLFSTNEFELYESEDSYDFSYTSFSRIRYTRITRDFTHAVFLTQGRGMADDTAREEFFLALRSAYLLAALKDRKVALHCVACSDDMGAFLISGRSGAGKSTLSELIKSSYDIGIFNGDLGLVGTEDGIPYVYGIPWCGTSQIMTKGRIKLTSVVFIHKALTNHIEQTDPALNAMTFMNRLITPAWTDKMLEARLNSGMMVVKRIRMYEFSFRKEKEAGKVFYERRIADSSIVQ